MAELKTPTVLTKIRELAPGDVIGNYRIDAPLGEGGMAQVYAVTHVHVGTRAALKIPQHGLEPAMAQRFLIEARAHLGLVGSAHIVPPMEVAIAPDGRPYLVTRLMSATLHSWRLDPSNELDDADQELSRWIRFGIQIALGLDAAHSQTPPIVHRDLKPPNIYVDPKVTVIDGKEVPLVQIGDFGLAWSPGDENTPMGTPEYVAPEHASGAPPTARSDLYALGIVLFELIEGHVPFEGADVMETLLKQRNDPIPPMRNQVVVSRVPELQELMDRLLAKNEADRPASARVVVNDLLSILRHFERRDERTSVGVDPRKAAPTMKIPVREVVESGRLDPRAVPLVRRPVVLVAALLALLVIGGVVVAKLGAAPEKVEVQATKVVEPAELPKIEPKVEPPVVAALVPVAIDSGAVGPDELVAVRSSEPKGHPKVAVAVNKCTPDDDWKKRVKGDLREIESNGTKLSPVDREQAITPIFNAAQQAATAADCDRVNRQVADLAKRALP